MNFPLIKARHQANKLVMWLSPFCEHIEIAGSIRRQRSTVNDIDLVVIPKRESTDLFGGNENSVNLLHRHLRSYIAGEGEPKFHWISGENNPDGKLWSFKWDNEIRVDIFVASPENFGTIWLVRTGSKEVNIWMCERAQRTGMEFKVGEGLKRDGMTIASRTEADIYAALDLPLIEPQEREIETIGNVIKALTIGAK